jgi:hypothetical protein
MQWLGGSFWREPGDSSTELFPITWFERIIPVVFIMSILEGNLNAGA